MTTFLPYILSLWLNFSTQEVSMMCYAPGAGRLFVNGYCPITRVYSGIVNFPVNGAGTNVVIFKMMTPPFFPAGCREAASYRLRLEFGGASYIADEVNTNLPPNTCMFTNGDGIVLKSTFTTSTSITGIITNTFGDWSVVAKSK